MFNSTMWGRWKPTLICIGGEVWSLPCDDLESPVFWPCTDSQGRTGPGCAFLSAAPQGHGAPLCGQCQGRLFWLSDLDLHWHRSMNSLCWTVLKDTWYKEVNMFQHIMALVLTFVLLIKHSKWEIGIIVGRTVMEKCIMVLLFLL